MPRQPNGLAKIIIVLITILLLGGTATIIAYTTLMSPVDPQATDTIDIVIPKGQSLAKTAENLAKLEIIRSPLSLRIAAYQTGQSIQAGRFRVSPAMTPAEILTQLKTGKLDYWVTLLEGWRREEIAEAIETTASENGARFDKGIFLDLTKDLEGNLFPDTYLFSLDASEENIISILTSTLDKRISSEMESAISKSGKTRHQILTMASLIEREARADSSRKIVSGILWKRLDNSWPLQVDATLQYARGYDSITKTWWKEPTAADKTINSPYNTYQNQGLPPGPICAPSLSSIQAAIYPTPSEYWFYISDLSGNMHYAITLAEHNQNIATYLR
jgi:UPF0755 protein